VRNKKKFKPTQMESKKKKENQSLFHLNNFQEVLLMVGDKMVMRRYWNWKE